MRTNPQARQDASAHEPSVSVLILTKNGEKSIGQCLNWLLLQSFKDFEILVIDSGSNDKTLEIASTYPLRIIQMPEAKFHHAQTRNLAVSLSRGKFIVFLVQDAYPADDKWLEELLSPFSHERIAATYSRQKPQIETSPLEKAFIEFTYPNDKRRFVIKRKEENNPGSFVLLSDVSSAYRKDLVEFNSTMDCCEDQEIALRLIEAGFEVAYVPNSVVVHGHSYNLRDLFKRYQAVGNPAGRFIKSGFNFISSARYVVRIFALSFRYIINEREIKSRAFWFAYSIPYNTVKILAFATGYLNHRLRAVVRNDLD